MNYKNQYIVLGIAVLLGVVLAGVFGFRQSSAEASASAVVSNLNKSKNELAIAQKSITTKNEKLLADETGISVSQVEADKVTTESFFKGAFTWTSGAEYDKSREKYISILGKSNKFVSTYMLENTKVDTTNKIDAFDLKSIWDSIDMYPVEKVNNSSYKYVAVITYYVYKSRSDLSAKNKLSESRAIVMFTVTGENDNRTLTDVSAWAGLE